MRRRGRRKDKPLVWPKGEIKTPPFSQDARIEVGTLLRRVQAGEILPLPASRPMPTIGPRCHELRVNDEGGTWRLVYRIDDDAIVIVQVFKKTTQRTPQRIIDDCKRRLRHYDDL